MSHLRTHIYFAHCNAITYRCFAFFIYLLFIPALNNHFEFCYTHTHLLSNIQTIRVKQGPSWSIFSHFFLSCSLILSHTKLSLRLRMRLLIILILLCFFLQLLTLAMCCFCSLLVLFCLVLFSFVLFCFV